MEKIKYIKGDYYKSKEIKKAFLDLNICGVETFGFDEEHLIYYIKNNRILVIEDNDLLSQLLKEHGEEIKLPEEKKKLPKTWEEFVKKHHEFNREHHDHLDFYKSIEENFEYCLKINNILSKKEAESLLALIKLKKLRDYYNDGWEPDFNLKNDKFCIRYFKEDVIDTDVFQHHKHFLAFRTEELRDEFLNNFKELIEKAKMWL